jgi:carbon-monoxide dehydrogenase small subunit
MKTTLTVNGRSRTFAGPGLTRLLDVLRESFALTGTKEGCGEGECGACTVLLDGAPVNSCLLPIGQLQGRKVTTVEGLAGGGALDALQQAFLDHGAAQCGICTPGMLLAASVHVRAGGGPSPEAIRTALSGNLCRCTGYHHIVDAVAAAAAGKRGRRSGSKRVRSSRAGRPPASGTGRARRGSRR